MADVLFDLLLAETIAGVVCSAFTRRPGGCDEMSYDRHCERSEAIQLWRRDESWIASSLRSSH
jgi:hypothetical protein